MNPVFDISIYWIIVANQKDLLYNLSNPSPLTSFKQKTIEFVKHERNFVRKNPGIPVKPPSTGYPKDFKTNWIFMSWSFLRRLVKLFLPEDLRRPTCESFTYFPNWLCFKAFVWALPVHGDDLQIYIYIYTIWYGLSEVTDMFQLGILSQATGLMSRCPYFAFAFLDCIAPSIHE